MEDFMKPTDEECRMAKMLGIRPDPEVIIHYEGIIAELIALEKEVPRMDFLNTLAKFIRK